jgi:hypothetical protein
MVNFAHSSRPARPYLTIVPIDEKLPQSHRVKKGMGIIFNFSASFRFYYTVHSILLFVTKFETIQT